MRGAARAVVAVDGFAAVALVGVDGERGVGFEVEGGEGDDLVEGEGGAGEEFAGVAVAGREELEVILKGGEFEEGLEKGCDRSRGRSRCGINGAVLRSFLKVVAKGNALGQ